MSDDRFNDKYRLIVYETISEGLVIFFSFRNIFLCKYTIHKDGGHLHNV